MTRLWPLLLVVLVGWVEAQVPAAQGVYYEIFVRSFQDSDGDGIGDFRGVIERLDYLEELGITGLWLMPIHPSASYHGYDVTDYFAVHPDFGTLDDFRELLAEAHARGIRVIIDLVVNHTSSSHPWFQAARSGDPAYRDYYLWSERSRDWRGTGGGPAWHLSPGGYYLGLFWSEMPDLNHTNPVVVAAINDIAGFWLELGVDGFRIDAIQHVVENDDGVIANTPENVAWVERFNTFVRGYRPGAFIVGETWTATQTIAGYHRDAGLDMSFNYPLWDAILSSLQATSPRDLRVTLEQDERFYPEGALRATFLSNHDQIRPATTLGFLRRDVARLKLAAGLLLTLPGTPFLYYGEEIGMPNGAGDRDEEKRTPMLWEPGPGAGFTTGEPWYALSSDDAAITVAAQRADPDSLWHWYRQRIALRRAHPALATGATEVLEVEARGVLAFTRSLAGETILVLANLGNQPVAVDLEALDIDVATELLTGQPAARSYQLERSALAVLRLP